MNSVRLSIRISTRSPKPTPRRLQRARQCGHAAVEFSPRRGVAEKSERRRIGLHQRVPGQLVGPVLPSREVRLIGRRRLSGQRLELPGCAALIFDQTCVLPRSHYGLGGQGTTPREWRPSERTGTSRSPPATRRAPRADVRRGRRASAGRHHVRDAVARHVHPARRDGRAARASASHRCARHCAHCAVRAWCNWNRIAATSSHR